MFERDPRYIAWREAALKLLGKSGKVEMPSFRVTDPVEDSTGREERLRMAALGNHEATRLLQRTGFIPGMLR